MLEKSLITLPLQKFDYIWKNYRFILTPYICFGSILYSFFLLWSSSSCGPLNMVSSTRLLINMLPILKADFIWFQAFQLSFRLVLNFIISSFICLHYATLPEGTKNTKPLQLIMMHWGVFKLVRDRIEHTLLRFMIHEWARSYVQTPLAITVIIFFSHWPIHRGSFMILPLRKPLSTLPVTQGKHHS